jgi:hypothetical protein
VGEPTENSRIGHYIVTAGLSCPTVIKAIQHLTSVKITREATGRQRGRLFIYDRYLAIQAEGTEPLPR